MCVTNTLIEQSITLLVQLSENYRVTKDTHTLDMFIVQTCSLQTPPYIHQVCGLKILMAYWVFLIGSMMMMWQATNEK